MDSSDIQIIQQQEQQQQEAPIETIETMMENLLKRWKRRQRWHLFFTSSEKTPQGKSKWRTQLISFMNSTPIHIISILLLLIDLVLVTLELSSNMVSCSYKSSQLLDPNCSCKQLSVKVKVPFFFWYHVIGIGILCLLFLKSVALMLGLGFGFFKRPGCVVDGVVVGVALLLEAVLERGGGGGLVVVVSLWRVLRVVESTFELSDEAIEGQIERIVCQFESLKEENGKLVQIILEKDCIIDMLQQELTDYKTMYNTASYVER